MLFLVVLVSLIGLVYYYFTRTFNYWKDRNVPGPKPTFFFGNIMDQALRRTNSATVLRRIYNQYPDEKVVGIYRMTTPCLMLRDLDIIKYVMIKDFDQFIDRGVEFSDKGLGLNIFHTDGEKWRILRNRFTPIFTSGKLKNMLYLITERGDKFLEYVGDRCDKQAEQPIHVIVQKFTMSTIAACAFGIDLDENMSHTLEKIDRMIFTANFSHELDMMYPGILKWFGGSLFPAFVSEFFDNLAQKVIAQRGGKPTNRKDFMDMILELRQQKEVTGSKRFEDENVKTFELTDSVIAAQAFVFFAAGYETSASTMTYLLYELAVNPEIQDKLISEIDEGLKRHNGEVNYELLTELNYLDKVFDETLRKHPLIDPLHRNAKSDYQVPGTDVTIKKGQTVIVSPWGIQHDPKHYPNPNKFDPERFSPENANNMHSCAYLPFGVGPRNCIGMRFAKVQSKVCIIKLLSQFRVDPSKNTPTQIQYDPMRLVIFPVGGILLNVTRRNV